jgi:hypothetical protein
MAYNSNKGNQHMGDVQYEGDPTDVQIDFENDFIALKTNGQQRFIVSGSAITASVNFVPSGTLSHDLGSVDLEWRRLYVEEVVGDVEGAIRFDAINDEGDSISRGQVVYIKGVTGQTPTVALAAADDATKMPAFGLAGSNAAQGASVQIVTFGSIGNLNLSTLFPGETFAEGDPVFVQTGSGGVSGSITTTRPTGSNNLLQNIGQVVRNGGGGDGQIKVGGAGRSNATPNLDKGYLFVGNDSDCSVQDNTIYVSSSANRVGINTTTLTHTLTVAGDISASVNISASAFYGDGTNLTNVNLPSATLHSSSFTVSSTADILAINSSGSVITASLPAANTYVSGQRLSFKDVGGSGSVNNIAIQPSGSETIDGSTAGITITTNYGAIELFSNGVNSYHILSTN